MLILNLPCCCHITLPCIICFGIRVVHQRIQTTHLRASRCHHCHCCHYCNVDFVLFHIVTCYTYPLLSCIHVDTTYLLKITCTNCHMHDVIREVRVDMPCHKPLEFSCPIKNSEHIRPTYPSTQFVPSSLS